MSREAGDAVPQRPTTISAEAKEVITAAYAGADAAGFKIAGLASIDGIDEVAVGEGSQAITLGTAVELSMRIGRDGRPLPPDERGAVSILRIRVAPASTGGVDPRPVWTAYARQIAVGTGRVVSSAASGPTSAQRQALQGDRLPHEYGNDPEFLEASYELEAHDPSEAVSQALGRLVEGGRLARVPSPRSRPRPLVPVVVAGTFLLAGLGAFTLWGETSANDGEAQIGLVEPLVEANDAATLEDTVENLAERFPGVEYQRFATPARALDGRINEAFPGDDPLPEAQITSRFGFRVLLPPELLGLFECGPRLQCTNEFRRLIGQAESSGEPHAFDVLGFTTAGTLLVDTGPGRPPHQIPGVDTIGASAFIDTPAENPGPAAVDEQGRPVTPAFASADCEVHFGHILDRPDWVDPIVNRWSDGEFVDVEIAAALTTHPGQRALTFLFPVGQPCIGDATGINLATGSFRRVDDENFLSIVHVANDDGTLDEPTPFTPGEAITVVEEVPDGGGFPIDLVLGLGLPVVGLASGAALYGRSRRGNGIEVPGEAAAEPERSDASATDDDGGSPATDANGGDDDGINFMEVFLEGFSRSETPQERRRRETDWEVAQELESIAQRRIKEEYERIGAELTDAFDAYVEAMQAFQQKYVLLLGGTTGMRGLLTQFAEAKKVAETQDFAFAVIQITRAVGTLGVRGVRWLTAPKAADGVAALRQAGVEAGRAAAAQRAAGGRAAFLVEVWDAEAKVSLLRLADEAGVDLATWMARFDDPHEASRALMFHVARQRGWKLFSPAAQGVLDRLLWSGKADPSDLDQLRRWAERPGFWDALRNGAGFVDDAEDTIGLLYNADEVQQLRRLLEIPPRAVASAADDLTGTIRIPPAGALDETMRIPPPGALDETSYFPPPGAGIHDYARQAGIDLDMWAATRQHADPATAATELFDAMGRRLGWHPPDPRVEAVVDRVVDSIGHAVLGRGAVDREALEQIRVWGARPGFWSWLAGSVQQGSDVVTVLHPPDSLNLLRAAVDADGDLEGIEARVGPLRMAGLRLVTEQRAGGVR